MIAKILSYVVYALIIGCCAAILAGALCTLVTTVIEAFTTNKNNEQ